MPNMKSGFSIFARQLMKEFTGLSEKFADAVKDSANHSSGKILEAVDEFADPSSALIEKLSTAVKDGENEQILEAVDGLIHPSTVLFHKITDTVKESAILVGEKMMVALEESVQPTPIDAKKLSDAVRDGTSFAGEKVVKVAEDFSEMIKAFKIGKGKTQSSE